MPPWRTRWNWSRKARKFSTSAANPRGPARRRSAKQKNCAASFPSSKNSRRKPKFRFRLTREARRGPRRARRRREHRQRRRAGRARRRRDVENRRGISAPVTFACTRQGTPHNACSKIRPTPTSVREVGEFFSGAAGRPVNDAGVAAEQVVLDPGIGFGKTLEHNLQLLAGLRSFTKWRRPLLLGVSRKSFIEKLTGAEVNERLPASLACATLAVESGVQIIRTHDVAETVQAVRMAEAILQHSKCGLTSKKAGGPRWRFSSSRC